MSQIGARGLALAGDTATAIINYFYPGSDVIPLTDDQILRVNIGHQLTAASLKSDTPGMSLQLISGDGTDPQIISTLAAKDSVRLMISSEQSKALEIAELVNHHNNERRLFDANITEHAFDMILKDESFEAKKATVLFHNEWH
jgi:hypothetical protein